MFSGDVADLLLTAEEIPGNWMRSSTGGTIAMSDGPCAVEDDRPYRERVDRGFITPPVRSLADLSEGAGIMELTFLAQRVTRYESVGDTITLLVQANDQEELPAVDGIAEAAVAKFSRAGS